MKKICYLAWILLFAMLFCACNNAKGEDTSQTEENNTPVPRDVTLVESGRALYRIVLPEVCDSSVSRAADTLKTRLKAVTGASFSTTDDYTRNGEIVESEGEIIIGNCKRTEMQQALSEMSYRDYAVRVTDKNILIAGFDPAKIADAVYAFIEVVNDGGVEKDGKNAVLHWKEDLFKPYTDYPLSGLTLGGVSLSEYRIVYPTNLKTNTEIGLYLEMAHEVQDLIGTRCGYVLKICPDSVEPSPYEILIGKTNRAESADWYASADGPRQLDYGVTVRNQKLLIYSGGLYSLESAVKDFSKSLSKLTTPAMDGAAGSMSTLWDSSVPAAKGDYRFMTYNILFEDYATGFSPAEVEIRKELVSGLLMEYLPDVVALQEHFEQWGNQLPELIDAEYSYVCFKRADGVVNRSPLIYRTDRFNLVESAMIELDKTVTNNRRVVTWCILEDKETKDQFAVIGTHWDPFDDSIKLENAKATAQIAAQLQSQRGLPVIAMGDFNSIPGTGSYVTFRSQGGFEKVTATSGVDHIFYSNQFTAVAQGFEQNNCARKASDHFPVWMDVTLG